MPSGIEQHVRLLRRLPLQPEAAARSQAASRASGDLALTALTP